MRENLVKKPKKDVNDIDDYEDEDIELEDDGKDPIKVDDNNDDDDDFDLDDDDDDDDDDDLPKRKRSSYSMDASKKRLFIVMGCIVGGTILLLLILYIMSLVGHKSYSYEEIEKQLVSGAKSYFNDYPANLPKNDGDVVEVEHSTLVAAGKMDDISNYLKDGVSCTASVRVTKSGSEYLYSPLLNCGDAYQTISLAEKIKNDNGTVNSGDGLYVNGNYYMFRGENVNNYVQLDNALWRVVKISKEGNVILILSDGLIYSQPWDNRYNEDRMYESGINNYSVSRIKDYLKKLYTDPSEKDGELILSDADKAKMITYNVCIGKRSPSSQSKNNSEECKKQERNQKMGLLTLSDYLYTSLDPNCKDANTKSCMNYNYLAMKDEWWTTTANSEDDSTVFKVDRNGVVKVETCATYSLVRPVIYLNNNVLFKSGKGSLDKPYEVR